MTDYIQDPDLNRLIREINEGDASSRGPTRSEVSHGEALGALLSLMLERGASDLLLIPGIPPVYRSDGDLLRSKREPVTSDEIRTIFAPYLDERLLREVDSAGSADFSLRISTPQGPWRFRVNLHRQRGAIAAAIRSINPQVPELPALGLPAEIASFALLRRGLILICGPTGSGKSTTLAALVREINRTRAAHIVTIEDPIEYDHANEKSIVEQIEIGRDAFSFSVALRSALRQDPDVLLVGEMRDAETASTAITAAETGHLVLSTLHTSDAAQAVHRIVDLFPAEQQPQIHRQLALSLHATVTQQLIPRDDRKGRIAACEVMIVNDAVRNHIRNQRLQNLYSEITLGRKSGMRSMEESLASLVRDGVIRREEATSRARFPTELEGHLNR